MVLIFCNVFNEVRWIAIQIRNHRYPITKVQVEEKGEWVELERQFYNYFIKSFKEGKTIPFKIRVTGSNNQVIEDEIVNYVENGVQQSTKQFEIPSGPQNTAGGSMISVILVIIAIVAHLM